MITPSDIIKYIKIENSVNSSELNYKDLHSIEALEDQGIALTNLKVLSILKDIKTNHVRFSTSKNFSKFKPGDKVLLICGEKKSNATIIENQTNSIILGLSKKTKIDEAVICSIILKDFYYNESIIRSLEKLCAGYPGWIHFNSIFNNNNIYKNQNLEIGLTEAEYLQLQKHCLDSSQIECISSALKMPPFLAIQGPPGTGKTYVLAVTAELLIDRGERVVIIAPTHQAVNNALNTIKNINSERKCIKIGDLFKTEGLNNSIDVMLFNEFDLFLKKNSRREGIIIGMTFHSAVYNLINKLNQFMPTVVILDEAGQLSSTNGAIIGMIGAGTILLYGDDRQMPPIFNNELKGHELSTSLFSQVKKLNKYISKRLEITYRMNKQITDIVSKQFYKLNDTFFLKSSEKAALQEFQVDLSSCNDVFIRNLFENNNSINWISYKSAYYQQLNEIEVYITVKILDYLLSQKVESNKIAVVTPFRKHAAEIRRKMLENYDVSLIPIVDTVERVQGLTVDIIIVSFCASDPDYIENVSEFLFSENRINVAISRARKKVIIICSDELLTSKPKLVDSFIAKEKLKQIRNESYLLKFIQ